MSRLPATERETILTVADDEDTWHVFTDSARLTRWLLRVAAQWGVTPTRRGLGFEFSLPLAAVKFSGPRRLTEARKTQLAQARAARQKLRFRTAELVATTSSASRRGEGLS